jgi:hypothetical protein
VEKKEVFSITNVYVCILPLVNRHANRTLYFTFYVFYVLLAVHLDVILGNDQLDALFLNVFILCLYMFRAASAHHQEVQIVLIHHLV